MLEIKNVHGSQVTIPEIEVNVDTVYVRSNIQKKSKINKQTNETIEYWVYDEIQYTYREWLQISSEKTILQQNELNATQEAIDYLMLNSSNNMPQTIDLMKVGANDMAITPVNYLVMRIEKELELKGLEQAKSYYSSYFNIDSFKQFKEAVDAKLIADGHENVIDKTIV